jgi:hypothetical protein
LAKSSLAQREGIRAFEARLTQYLGLFDNLLQEPGNISDYSAVRMGVSNLMEAIKVGVVVEVNPAFSTMIGYNLGWEEVEGVFKDRIVELQRKAGTARPMRVSADYSVDSMQMEIRREVTDAGSGKDGKGAGKEGVDGSGGRRVVEEFLGMLSQEEIERVRRIVEFDMARLKSGKVLTRVRCFMVSTSAMVVAVNDEIEAKYERGRREYVEEMSSGDSMCGSMSGLDVDNGELSVCMAAVELVSRFNSHTSVVVTKVISYLTKLPAVTAMLTSKKFEVPTTGEVQGGVGRGSGV